MITRPRRTIRAIISLAVTVVSALGVITMGVTTLAILAWVIPTLPWDSAVLIGLPSNGDSLAPTLFISFDAIVPVVMGALAFSLVLVVGATSTAAWVVAGRVVRPLATIAEVARSAQSGDLTSRVNLDGPHDEVHGVAAAIDAMLDDLERSFHASQRFAANASHELTTPLAITQAIIDVELARPDRTDPESERALLTLRAVNRRTLETVEALLDLAELGQAGAASHPMNVSDIVRDVVAHLESVASDAHVTVVVSAGDHRLASGDRVLTRQAIENLVMNAIRHNVVGGHVAIRVVDSGSSVVLAVENSGDIVDGEIVATWREPFVRGQSRVSGPGRGLGLALVDAIATRQGGLLSLEPRPGGGIVARLTLPAVDELASTPDLGRGGAVAR